MQGNFQNIEHYVGNEEIGNELSAKMFILIAVGVFRYLQVVSGYVNIEGLLRRFWCNLSSFACEV